MINIRPFGLPASFLSVCGNFFYYYNYFLHTIINLIFVKLCMMVVLIELYPFILHSVTLTLFQGHISTKLLELKDVSFLSLEVETLQIVKYLQDQVYTVLGTFVVILEEVIDLSLSCLSNTIILAFCQILLFRAFKVDSVITFISLWSSAFLYRLDDLDLFQSHNGIRKVKLRILPSLI